MTLFLVFWLQVFNPPPPVNVIPANCSLLTLGLKTAVMGDAELRSESTKKWGNAWKSTVDVVPGRSNIVRLYHVTLFGNVLMCENRDGSSRQCWNSMIVKECERQRAK